MKKILVLLAIGLAGMSSPVNAEEETGPPPTSTIATIDSPADVGVPGQCADIYGHSSPVCPVVDICLSGGQTAYYLVPCDFDSAGYAAWCEARPGHPVCGFIPEVQAETPRHLPATGSTLMLIVGAIMLIGLGVIITRRLPPPE